MKNILFVILLCTVCSAYSQENKSTEENYRKRTEHMKYDYATQYDNGYVTLRDGTTLEGKISLVGKGYDQVWLVIIRTNGGQRYALRPRSLKEYGLSNSLTNDTPGMFDWIQMNPPSAMNAFQDIRTGTCDFGYVKTKTGKTVEGELTIKEINGRIKSITVKNTKEKDKFDADDISNFGVKEYADPKLIGVYSIIPWKKSFGTGMLVNQKSIPAPGKVTLNDGSTKSGYIMVVKKSEITTQIRVSETADAKPEKIKYADVKSYTIEQRIDDYTNLLKNIGQPFDEIHPSRKFYPGGIALQNGTILEGMVAKAANADITDVFYAADKNAIIKGYKADEVDRVVQNISDEDMAAYDAAIYDRDHAQDYLIQRPAQWKYAVKKEEISVTEFQTGYLILNSGEEKVGALEVTKNGAYVKFVLLENNEKVKYSSKDVAEYGLIENRPHTDFPAHLYTGLIVKRQPGFIKIFGKDEIIKGDLKISKYTNGFNGNTKETMKIDDKDFHLESVEIYGLIDVPVAKMTKNGALVYGNEKLNFHPGSFMMDGAKKEGFIAWAKPNGSGKYTSFFFAEKMDGVANVYSVKDGASDVVQNIPTAAPEVPVSTEDAEQVFKGQGYVMGKNGDKIAEGTLQIVYPAGTWFSPEVLVLGLEDSQDIIKNNDAVKSAFIEVDGKTKEFLYYEGVFVEVLDRDNSLVHFRNPYPTIETLGGKLLNRLVQGAVNDFNQEQAEAAAVAQSQGRIKGQATLSVAEIKIYALENLIYDESTGRVTMYAPAPDFYAMLDAELEGCIEYLTMDFQEKWGIRRMKNPLETLKFINENMNN